MNLACVLIYNTGNMYSYSTSLPRVWYTRGKHAWFYQYSVNLIITIDAAFNLFDFCYWVTKSYPTPALGPPAEEGHGAPEVRPEEDMKMLWGLGAALLSQPCLRSRAIPTSDRFHGPPVDLLEQVISQRCCSPFFVYRESLDWLGPA